MQRVLFEIGEAFDSDDPVAQWATTIALAWNDLELWNRRLLEGMERQARHSDNFRDARQVALCVAEISQFLRDSQQIEEVRKAIKALPCKVRRDYKRSLKPTDPSKETLFNTKLWKARNATAHYSKMTRDDLKKGMRKAAKQEGDVTEGPRFLDLYFGFADTIAIQLFFAAADPNEWEQEFSKFIEQLREIVLPLTRFMQAALKAYIEARPDVVRIERAAWPPS
jgi:hypothetical protein